jgi:predicted homoserine dehydrogenase-like protein
MHSWRAVTSDWKMVVGNLPALLAAAPFLATAPRGRRQGVIVLPGWGADDRSTVAIRRFLATLGYDVHGWNRGHNIRRADADLPTIVEQASRLRAATALPVSLWDGAGAGSWRVKWRARSRRTFGWSSR